MNKTDLTGQVAVVTGASRGIGQAIAIRLGRLGASVVVNYSRDSSGATETVTAIEAAGSRATGIRADVTKPAEIEALFAAARTQFGGLDIVVANAGLDEGLGPVLDVTETDYDRLFNVNAKGAFFTMQQAARMVSGGGSIVYIGSGSTLRPVTGFGLSGCWFSRGPRQDQPLGSTPALADMAQSLHEHSCHALVEAWLLAGDGLADESYGREDFPGRDVLARVPARYRPGQERAQRRLELVEETLREAIVGGVTGVQRGGETALGGDEFGEALGPPQERVPWAQCGPERCGSVDTLVDLVLHYGDDEVGPAREMPVQRADAHSRKIGDLLRGRVHAAVREHGLGGLHEREDIPLRVRALPPRGVGAACRRGRLRADRLGCHGPPLAKRKSLPYSSGKSFRLTSAYLDAGPRFHVALASGEPKAAPLALGALTSGSADRSLTRTSRRLP
jgi:hypothetical protein